MLNCFLRSGIAKKNFPKPFSLHINICRQFSVGLGFDPNKDYYKILGIQAGAEKKDIKKAFAKMAKLHHPDKNDGKFSPYLTYLGDDTRFKEVSEAYEVLNSKTKKSDYDNMRNQGGGFGGADRSQNTG